MQMSPLREPKINIVTTRRDSGPDRSSTTKSPIDSPMKLTAITEGAHYPSRTARPFWAGCID